MLPIQIARLKRKPGVGLKKLVTITGATGAGTDYQVLLKVGESSGSSSPDFYFNTPTTTFPAAKNDAGDVQFTDSGGAALPQWVEQVTGTTPNRVAWFWIKVSDDLGSNRSIYCTYRNGAAKTSDGDSVFALFDDFDSGTLNAAKWAYTEGSGGLTISSGELVLAGSTSFRRLKSFATTFGDNLEAMGRVFPPATTLSSVGHFGFDDIYIFENVWDQAKSTFLTRTAGGVGSRTGLASRYQSTYYRMQVRRSGGASQMFIDGTQVFLAGVPNGTTADARVCLMNVYDSGSTGKVDWIAVKKYQTTEPAFLSAGSETPA